MMGTGDTHLSDLDLSLGEEETVFVINGHKLSNYSARQNHVVIDGHYVCVVYRDWIDEAVSRMGLQEVDK